MLKTLQQTIKNQQLDGIWLTSTTSLKLFLGINIEPMERFLGAFITSEQCYVLANKLFVLEENDLYILVEYYDHQDVASLINQMSLGYKIGIEKDMKAYTCIELFSSKQVSIITNLIDELRVIKTNDEIDKMIKASKINDQVMGEVKSFLKEGISELEVVNFIHERFKYHKTQGVSFDPIVAFGENGADPHALPSNRTLKKGDSIIVDMGCRVNGYCSDMTRTFFCQENTARKAYEICLKANEEAIKAIKPGITFAQIDQIARDIIEQAGYKENFFHRLGHGIGQEVHEPFDVSGHNHQLVKPGMCFSIEPGIYVKDKFGIRIEDLVYINEEGFAVKLNHFDKKEVII